MSKKTTYCIFTSLVLLLLFSNAGNEIRAEKVKQKAPNVLVIYSSEDGEIDEYQRMLDMLLGHFTENITFVSSLEVDGTDVSQIDYLFYYGQQKEFLPKSLIDIIANYRGKMVAIGHNADQFHDRFSFIKWDSNNVVIDQAILPNQANNSLTFVPHYMMDISLVKEHQAEILLIGKKEHKEHPLFVKSESNYYFASDIVKPPFSIMFAEMLYEVFEENHFVDSAQKTGYIRLEDVHPLVDPEPLLQIGKILAKKNIPYMIAVIPVYTNPETKKQYHFSDSPKLLKVLKYMQKNGGTIVLHGYTHQFRLSETGEGFEFWDVEHNMPIYHEANKKVAKKTVDDFKSEKEYEQYTLTQKAFERNYIEERLTKGIDELTNYGLYPLAFEAPHYTMSQHGYEITAEYFSTYVGQLQLSDQNWEVMTTAPYMTKPTFLHGMQLLPETIGYVMPNDPQTIEKMLTNAKNYQFVRSGMVAGFYHPYLGVEKFTELIKELEDVPNVKWIDLKQMNNFVQTDNVTITSERGEIFVNKNQIGLFTSSISYFTYHLKNVITILLWCIAVIGFIAVLNFSIHLFFNQYRKHNVKRRESVG